MNENEIVWIAPHNLQQLFQISLSTKAEENILLLFFY